MKEPIRLHGITEFNQLRGETDENVEEIRNQGYSIVKDLLSETDLHVIRQKLDEIYEVQVKEIGGEERLSQINDVNLVRCLLAYDDYFLELSTNSTVLAIIQK